jgi:hypothetical protein
LSTKVARRGKEKIAEDTANPAQEMHRISTAAKYALPASQKMLAWKFVQVHGKNSAPLKCNARRALTLEPIAPPGDGDRVSAERIHLD